MEKLHGIDPDLPVIVLTAYGTIQRAVEAIQKGAHSFLTKPFKDAELIQRVRTCLEKRKLVKEVKKLRGMVSKQYGFDTIIGRDKKMERVLSDSDIISNDLIILNEAEHSLHEVKFLKDAKLEFEKDYLVELLELTQRNVSRAAKLAGKYRADFYELMKKCGLQADDFRKQMQEIPRQITVISILYWTSEIACSSSTRVSIFLPD